MGLTAGGDSRMLLACAREIAAALELFTVPHADPVGRTDVETATAIAHRFGLDHHCLHWVEGTVDDMRLWYYRSGALAGEPRGARSVRTYDQLGADGRRLRLSGAGVELARGIAWTEAEKRSAAHDGSPTELSAADLLGRIAVPRHPLLEAAAEHWIASLPGLGPLEAIDLLALETHGGWIGAISLGNPEAFTTTIYPFANRAVLDAIFGLPRDYRGSDRLRLDVIASRWPELGSSGSTTYRTPAVWPRRRTESLICPAAPSGACAGAACSPRRFGPTHERKRSQRRSAILAGWQGAA